MFAHEIDAHITLRILQPHHSGELFRVTDENRDHLRRWLPWLDGTKTVADSEAFVASMLRSFAETGAFACGIWHDGRLCGVVGYNRVDWSNKIAYPGYWLAESFQGKGIMTSCCRALLIHAFEEYALNRVVITVATENQKSQRIPDRLGFSREGVNREAEWLYDHYVDHTVNGLLKTEWKAENNKGSSRACSDLNHG